MQTNVLRFVFQSVSGKLTGLPSATPQTVQASFGGCVRTGWPHIDVRMLQEIDYMWANVLPSALLTWPPQPQVRFRGIGLQLAVGNCLPQGNCINSSPLVLLFLEIQILPRLKNGFLVSRPTGWHRPHCLHTAVPHSYNPIVQIYSRIAVIRCNHHFGAQCQLVGNFAWAALSQEKFSVFVAGGNVIDMLERYWFQWLPELRRRSQFFSFFVFFFFFFFGFCWDVDSRTTVCSRKRQGFRNPTQKPWYQHLQRPNLVLFDRSSESTRQTNFVWTGTQTRPSNPNFDRSQRPWKCTNQVEFRCRGQNSPPKGMFQFQHQ